MNKHYRKGFLLATLALVVWLAHSHLRATSPAYNFFFSPSDLYTNLASAKFDITNTGYSTQLPFSSKYPGNHWVALLVEEPAEHLKSYGDDFRVKIIIKNGEETITEGVANNSRFWFFGGPDRSGFALTTYRVPEHWLVGQNLVALAEVLKPSPSFQEKYGKQTIVVGKYSDE